MINYLDFTFTVVTFMLFTLLVVYIDFNWGMVRGIERTCFRYAIITTILRPFFQSGVELVIYTLLSWVGIYTAYLISNFYIKRKEKV